MPYLTHHQRELAQTIDSWIRGIEQRGGGDGQILIEAADHLPTFKQILDCSTYDERNLLCATYPGFYRFAKLLETVAMAIKDRTIPRPEPNDEKHSR